VDLRSIDIAIDIDSRLLSVRFRGLRSRAVSSKRDDNAAMEVDAALGLLARRGLVKPDERARVCDMAVAVVNLVIGLIRR
jgi:hypothetical protein